jgi:hypothetical protein
VLLSLLALLSKVVASFEDMSLSAVLNGGLGPLKIERGCTKKPIYEPAVRVSEKATVDGREMRYAGMLGVRPWEVN